jgi:cytochrome c oxidase cbb3-type subunit 3
MAELEDKLLDHNYDGIEEFDNPLPQWWVMLFIMSIIFGVIYMFYFHISGMGDLQLQEYANEFKGVEKVQVAGSFETGEKFAPEQEDKELLARGEKVYQVNCASCHAKDGGGGVGPNLTDDNWIHGGSMTDIVWTIVDGVPEKGMIAWRSILPKEDVIAVANFIRSLRGTVPANPKQAEGDLWDGEEKLPNTPKDVSKN